MSSYDRMRGLLSDRPVAFHPQLARMLGGINAALLFQQIAFWSNTRPDSEVGYGAWIWKTQAELRTETALTRYEQESARKQLRSRGILEEKLCGVPARLHYRIAWRKFFEMLDAGESAQGCDEVPNRTGETSPTGWRESNMQGKDAPARRSAEKPHSNTESITRETPEKSEETETTDSPPLTDAESAWVEVASLLVKSGEAPGWFRPWFRHAGLAGTTLTVCLPTSMRVGEKTFANLVEEQLEDSLVDLWREVSGDPNANLVLEGE